MILKYLYNNNSINCYDKGVAVYNQYCKPLTYPITNTSLWTFTIISVTTSTSTTSTSTTRITTTSTLLLTLLTKGIESNNSKSFCNQWWKCFIIVLFSFLVIFAIISALIWV
jgi:hypothetical protein